MYVSDFAEASLLSLHHARLLDCWDLGTGVTSPTFSHLRSCRVIHFQKKRIGEGSVAHVALFRKRKRRLRSKQPPLGLLTVTMQLWLRELLFEPYHFPLGHTAGLLLRFKIPLWCNCVSKWLNLEKKRTTLFQRLVSMCLASLIYKQNLPCISTKNVFSLWKVVRNGVFENSLMWAACAGCWGSCFTHFRRGSHLKRSWAYPETGSVLNQKLDGKIKTKHSPHPLWINAAQRLISIWWRQWWAELEPLIKCPHCQLSTLDSLDVSWQTATHDVQRVLQSERQRVSCSCKKEDTPKVLSAWWVVERT